MIGYTYGQYTYKPLDIERQIVISSWHIHFDEDGTLPPSEIAAWENMEAGEQWEGLTTLPPSLDHNDELAEDQIPREPVEEVREDVLGLLQFRNDEDPGVKDAWLQTPEEGEQHAEPCTPPQ